MYSQVFHIIFFLIFSIFNIGECSEVLTKQQQWDNLTNEVNSWRDGIGCPIDKGNYGCVMEN